MNRSKKNFVKIIGGSWKRKNIFFSDNEGLRPTLGRVRETLFNWLDQDLTSKNCLDLFSGTGALGFESLSRNAKSCVMVEKNKNNINELLKNKETLNAEFAQVIHSSADTFLQNNNKIFDVIFFDPPFNDEDSYKLLNNLSDALRSNGLVYLESKSPIEINQLKIIKSSRAGQVYFYLLTSN